MRSLTLTALARMHYTQGVLPLGQSRIIQILACCGFELLMLGMLGLCGV